MAMDEGGLQHLHEAAGKFREGARQLRMEEFAKYCCRYFNTNSVTVEAMEKELKACSELLQWKNEKGLPLLYVFASSKNADVARVLIQAGADTSLIIDGKSLRDFAKGRQNVLAVITECELRAENDDLKSQLEQVSRPLFGSSTPQPTDNEPRDPAVPLADDEPASFLSALYRKEALAIPVAALIAYFVYRMYTNKKEANA